MDVSLLIDAVVRQTIILIATLVRADGHRPGLERLADQVFLELNDELRRQGVRASLLAGLFGMKLRTYHDRVRRARESASHHGRPLFQAVYGYVRDNGPVRQWEIDGAFPDDHEKVLQAILDDLVENGLLFRSGRGASTRYGAMPAETEHQRTPEADITVVWVALYHHSPATVDELAEQVGGYVDLEALLDQLVDDGRARREVGDDGVIRYASTGYHIPIGDPIGWEAALFDHYQALVGAMINRLDAGRPGSRAEDTVGGSTYAFALPDGHPMAGEVLGLLRETRDQLSALRARVDEVTAAEGLADVPGQTVTFYCGQNVR